jgi:hypothetical protein
VVYSLSTILSSQGSSLAQADCGQGQIAVHSLIHKGLLSILSLEVAFRKSTIFFFVNNEITLVVNLGNVSSKL